MSFKNLSTITQSLHLVDTNQIFEQGRKQYMAGFVKSVNPYAGTRYESVWGRGYDEARDKFAAMQNRWKEQDRGQK